VLSQGPGLARNEAEASVARHLLSPPTLITSYRLSSGDHGSIEGENPHPTCSPFRLSEAWNFGLVLDLGNL
jgi:hypothetical protein